MWRRARKSRNPRFGSGHVAARIVRHWGFKAADTDHAQLMAQMASDALRNYCDPHPHLSECNDDSQCVRKEERKYICEKEAQNDKCKELDFPGEWTCGCRYAASNFSLVCMYERCVPRVNDVRAMCTHPESNQQMDLRKRQGALSLALQVLVSTAYMCIDVDWFQDCKEFVPFRVLIGCKGYDWFCNNIENKSQSPSPPVTSNGQYANTHYLIAFPTFEQTPSRTRTRRMWRKLTCRP